MNKTIGIIIVVVVIIAGAYVLMHRAPATTDTSSNLNTTTEQQTAEHVNNTTTAAPAHKVSAASGHVVFSVADAAADMQTIEQINMKVDKVEMYNKTSGWVTVSSTPKTYDLLKLNTTHKSELLVDVAAKAGTYDQVRLTIGSLNITTKTGATREAKMPSQVITLNTKIITSANKVSSINFDFLADKSLHATASGEFIFAPVVKSDAKSGANVDIDTSDNTVTIIGGESDSTTMNGMDVDGKIKLNFQIAADQALTVDSKNVIKVDGILH